MNPVPLPRPPTTPRISAMPRYCQAETAALVALLRQPGVRWTEITTEVLAEGSAITVLRRSLDADQTLFADEAAPSAALDVAGSLSPFRAAAGRLMRPDVPPPMRPQVVSGNETP